MDLVSILRIAIRALSRNKMRSALTMLGIIIGVGAVIAMVGVGQGASKQVQDQISAMGSNMLFVSSGTVNRGGLRLGWGQTKTLVYDDMKAMVQQAPAVKEAAPGSQTTAQVVFGSDNWFTNVQGTEPQYFDIRSWPMQEGVSFTESDVNSAADVAVIGATVQQNLFGAQDPIGPDGAHLQPAFQGSGRAHRQGTVSGHGAGPRRRHLCADHDLAEKADRRALAALHRGVRRFQGRHLRGAGGNHGAAARSAPHPSRAG
jgi:hypothetical protein